MTYGETEHAASAKTREQAAPGSEASMCYLVFDAFSEFDRPSGLCDLLGFRSAWRASHLISRDDFPLLWTSTVDTLLGEDVSVDLARSFLVNVDEDGWMHVAESVATMAWRGRFLIGPGRRLIVAPPLRSEDVEIESNGGTLRATLHLRTPFSNWAFFILGAGILVWKGAWLLALLFFLAPFVRCLLILEIWKWQVRNGVQELEELLSKGDKSTLAAGSNPSESKPRNPASIEDAPPQDIDHSGKWPNPDFAALIQILSRPCAGRVILAEWDGENDESLQNIQSQDDIEARILADIEPVKNRLDALLGPSTTVDRPLTGPGEDELLRLQWNHGGTSLYMVLRSADDWLYILTLENHSNRISL